MIIAKITRKIHRAAAVYSDFGFRGICSRLVGRIQRIIGRDDPAHADWLRQKSASDTAFDATNGTQTGGIDEIFDFRIIGENARFGLSHIATDPDSFTELIGNLDIDLTLHTFIDLGSGKGRALLLAADFPFRRIVGVEFATELHNAAKRNLEALDARGKDVSRIELVLGDAGSFAFPSEPLVVYLFNPFGSKVVADVARNLLMSWKACPRSITIVYMNPQHLSEFTIAGWRYLKGGRGSALLVPAQHIADGAPS